MHPIELSPGHLLLPGTQLSSRNVIPSQGALAELIASSATLPSQAHLDNVAGPFFLLQ